MIMTILTPYEGAERDSFLERGQITNTKLYIYIHI